MFITAVARLGRAWPVGGVKAMWSTSKQADKRQPPSSRYCVFLKEKSPNPRGNAKYTTNIVCHIW
eukprot:6060059-Amphidinium_carterae.1